MLNCEQVRGQLPVIETGEPATGEVRDHLATCAACRAEAEALRADLARMRRDLAALEPSPFLTDRVREALDETQPVTPQAPRRGTSWHWAMGAGCAAAAVVAAVLVLASQPGDSTPPNPGIRVADEPSAAEVAAEEGAPDEPRAAPPQQGPPSGIAWPAPVATPGGPPTARPLVFGRDPTKRASGARPGEGTGPAKGKGHLLLLLGETPDMGFTGEDVDVHHMHGRIFVSADRNVPWRPGAGDAGAIALEPGRVTHVAVEYRETPSQQACYVYLPPLRVGGRNPRGWSMHMERVSLEQTFEPGAQIALARTWREHRAVPSTGSVAFTLADARGRVSYVQARGDKGPLIARERRKDGTVRLHRIEAPAALPRAPTRVEVLRDGSVRLGGTTLHPPAGFVSGGPLSNSRWPALVEALGGVAQRREGSTASARRLVIFAQGDVPWRSVTNLLLACAHPHVRLENIDFLYKADAAADPRRVPWTMPTDQGVSASRAPFASDQVVADIKLLRRDGKMLIVHRLGRKGPVILDDRWDAQRRAYLAEQLRALAVEARAAKQRIHAEITAAGRIPYAEVWHMMRRCREAGIDQVLLSSGPP